MSSRSAIRATFHRLQDQEISWVGECPWTQSLGFGCESGRFFAETGSGIEALDVADDSINGVAFSGAVATFTSRESVTVVQRKHGGSLDAEPLLRSRDGAHGVAASRHPTFFAAQGALGVLAIRAMSGKCELRRIQRENEPFSAYQVVKIAQKDDVEFYAVAARSGGMLVFSYRDDWDISPARGHSFGGHDIVSITSLNHESFPLGIAALSLQGELIIIPDVTRGTNPGVVRFDELAGVPYAVSALRGHIIVLTSSELIVVTDVVQPLADGTYSNRQQHSWVVPVQASDIFSDGIQRIFLTTDGDVDEFQVDDLVVSGHGPASGNGRGIKTFEIKPRESRFLEVDSQWSTSDQPLVLATT